MKEDKINKMVDGIIQAIDTRMEKKPKSYFTQAKVIRTENGTAYVHIPGGVDETPVKETIACRKGDTVQVRVGDGSAVLVGNQTAPPTDDAEALVARAVAKVADKNATEAKTTADEAQQTANGIKQHFWADDDGAHITEVTHAEYEDDPDNAGGNLLARSNGIAVRDGLTELASFGATGAQIGKTDDYNLQLYNSFLYLKTGSKTWGYLRQISDSITGLDGIRLMSDTAGNGNGYAYVDVSRGTNKSQVDIGASVHGSTYARILLQKTSTGATVDITAKQGINFNTDTSTFTGDITASGDVTDGSSNVLSNKADRAELSNLIKTVSKSQSTGSISAGGYKNQAVTPTAPTGKSLIGCVSLHVTGTNSSYCQLIGFYINGSDINVQIKNTSSGSVTWTIEAIGLYM